jgi:hypothetical protein
MSTLVHFRCGTADAVMAVMDNTSGLPIRQRARGVHAYVACG